MKYTIFLCTLLFTLYNSCDAAHRLLEPGNVPMTPEVYQITSNQDLTPQEKIRRLDVLQQDQQRDNEIREQAETARLLLEILQFMIRIHIIATNNEP